MWRCTRDPAHYVNAGSLYSIQCHTATYIFDKPNRRFQLSRNVKIKCSINSEVLCPWSTGSNSVIGYSNSWSVFKTNVRMNSWWNEIDVECKINSQSSIDIILILICVSVTEIETVSYFYLQSIYGQRTMGRCVWYVFIIALKMVSLCQ